MSRLGEVKNTNPNVAWIDERGTWWFYIGMLALSRYAMFVFGFSSEAAWCAVISSHALITYWLIHYKVTWACLSAPRRVPVCHGASDCSKRV